MEAESSPWNYQGFHPAHPHDGRFVLLPVHGRALCFTSLAPVHTNFATPCEDRTLSAVISFILLHTPYLPSHATDTRFPVI